METMSEYISKLASYDVLEISIIRETKINKVLKGIIKLANIPKESEYNFRARSIELLKKWKHWDAPSAEIADKPAAEKESQSAPNGVHKDADNKEGDSTKEADATAADTDVPMPDADAKEPEELSKQATPAAVEKEKGADDEGETKPAAEPVAT